MTALTASFSSQIPSYLWDALLSLSFDIAPGKPAIEEKHVYVILSATHAASA